ncbi:MAG: hypothetical protein WCS65_14190 [Verrucomicrobiae bacterium]
MKTLCVIAGLVMLGTFIQAEEEGKTKARIEINGGQKVSLTPVSGPEGGYLRNFSRGNAKIEDGPDFNLIGETAPLPADRWVQASFTFVPESDGKVTIYLKGNFAKAMGNQNPDARWVYYDMVAVEGCDPLQNGDFEEATSGRPDFWNGGQDLRYVTSGMKALSGKAMVGVWHNNYCTQTINVTAGQQVTLTVNVKMGEVEPAKE